MDKLIILILALFLWNQIGISQLLTDEQAVVQMLRGESIEGEFTWRAEDKSLKRLALDIVESDTVVIKNERLSMLVRFMTSTDNDHYNDSLFLNILFERDIRIDSFFYKLGFIPTHFLKSDYNQASLNKLAFFTSKKSILYWKPWLLDYLTFLEVDSIGSALIYLKENFDCIKQLNSDLGDYTHFDTLDININLVRLGVLDDTLVVNDVIKKHEGGRRSMYKYLIEKLSKIRTQYAFSKIGEIMLREDFPVYEKRRINHLALSSFLVYVKNFPDKVKKRQVVMRRGAIVKYSKKFGKDYSTDEYLEMARDWYRKNKDNLELDYDKF